MILFFIYSRLRNEREIKRMKEVEMEVLRFIEEELNKREKSVKLATKEVVEMVS